MSGPREKTYSPIQIAIRKQHTRLELLNGKRLVLKLPHHPQTQEEATELEFTLDLLQLDMVRRNTGSKG
eukprot:4948419-Pleurochrysis_carterae.AAC.2